MQTSSTLIGRLSGLATILGGLLWALGGPTALNADILGISMEGSHLLLTLAGLCSLIGLTRLASHHARHYGRAGMAGAILASAGVVLIIASKNLPSSTSAEAGWNLFYLGMLVLVVGSLLFGIVALLVGKAWLFGAPLVAIGVLVILQLVFFLLMMGSFAQTADLGTVVLPILFGIAWSVLGTRYGPTEAKSSGDPHAPQVSEGGTRLAREGKATDALSFPLWKVLKRSL